MLRWRCLCHRGWSHYLSEVLSAVLRKSVHSHRDEGYLSFCLSFFFFYIVNSLMFSAIPTNLEANSWPYISLLTIAKTFSVELIRISLYSLRVMINSTKKNILMGSLHFKFASTKIYMQ